MNLHLATMPENIENMAPWLERRLVGFSLPEVVGELMSMRPKGSTPSHSLDETLGDYQSDVLERGLSPLPKERLRRLLQRPELLLELQTLVLASGSPYWSNVVADDDEMNAMAVRVAERVIAANVKVATSNVEAARPRAARARRLVLQFTSLAAALTLGWFIGQAGISNAEKGWNRTNLFANSPSPSDRLRRIAAAADEWNFNAATSPEALAAEIASIRKGCSRLLLDDHAGLPDRHRAQLREKCKAWATHFDQQLAALEAGGDAAAVRRAMAEKIATLQLTLRTWATELDSA